MPDHGACLRAEDTGGVVHALGSNGQSLNDGDVPTAAWAWRAMVGRFIRFGLLDRCSDAQQPAGERHGILVRRTGE